MRFKLLADEVLSTGLIAANAVIVATGANFDELTTLEAVGKAIELSSDEAGAYGDIGVAEADLLASKAGNLVRLSLGAGLAGRPNGRVLSRVLSAGPNLPTLTNDAGGIFSLSGRALMATANPMQAGTVYVLTFSLDGKSVDVPFYAAAETMVGTLPVGSNFVTYNGEIVTTESGARRVTAKV